MKIPTLVILLSNSFEGGLISRQLYILNLISLVYVKFAFIRK